MATDYLSALNVGSGLNTTEIIDALVNAERVPKEEQINKKIDEKNLSISALGELKSELSTFDNSLGILSGMTGTKASSSDNSIVTLDITDSSSAYAFSHNIEIQNIATSQSLVFSGFSSADDTLGAGTLNISFGTWSSGTFTQNATNSSTLSISDGADSLTDVKNVINDADIGLTATILQIGENNYNLIIKSQTGLDNSIKIDATETVSGSGLASLDYSSYDNSIELVAASDANFSLDGVSITRESNEIDDLLDGVTITLLEATSSAETLAVQYDVNDAATIMQSLVDEINLVSSKLRDLSARGLNGAESGPLVGDPIVRNLINQIQSITTDPIYGYGDDPLYMTSFGVQTERDGSFSLNIDKFTKTFNDDPDSFLAIVQDRVATSTPSVTGYTVGSNWEPGVFNLSIDASDNATIDGNAMTVSSGLYHSSSGDTNGLYLDIDGDVSSASIYLGRSIVSSLQDLISSHLVSNSDIDNRISNYNDNVAELQDDLISFDEKMVSLRERYTEKYAVLNSVMQSVKSTQTSLDNMIEAWKGSMRQ